MMAFFLPLEIGLSNLFLILFFTISGYFLIIKKQFIVRRTLILIFSLLPVFLLYTIGLLYSSPPFEGINIIGRNIAFLLCPLILFFYSNEVLSRVKNSLYHGIVYGSVLSTLILLTNNFLNYFATRPFPRFDDEIFNYYYTYYSFTDLLEMHPTYLGVYLIFAISILLKNIFSNKSYRSLKVMALLLLSLGIVFINSRIIFLLYVLVIVSALFYTGFYYYIRNKYWTLSLVVIFTIIGVFSTIKILSDTFIISRLTSELKWELTDQIDSSYSYKKGLVADSRIPRWQSAIDAIAQKPVFGYGTHSEKDILAIYYKKNGLEVSLKNRYDAHNIYLSFMLEYGILGLCILLFYLFSNLYLSIKARNVHFFLLFLMICIVGCFESYLKNNAAITFVAFFSSVLLFSVIPQKLTGEKS